MLGSKSQALSALKPGAVCGTQCPELQDLTEARKLQKLKRGQLQYNKLLGHSIVELHRG